MDISLKDAGKKYYREWIFRKVNLSFAPGQKTVILGPNGSGKSTLLQVIAGAILPTEGTISFSENQKEIDSDDVYREVSLAAPYLELIEEFTLREIVKFHMKFKPLLGNNSVESFLEITGFTSNSDKAFKYFSSGMKQKVKLALALLSDSKVLLLDEPCSNLDSNAVLWYDQMVKQYSGDRIIIVASNEYKEEYSFCNRSLSMSDFKVHTNK